MKCPICKADIKFSYIVSEKSYIIKDGKIIRDDAWEGPAYDTPYLEFYCSNDREHSIDTAEVCDWAIKIENVFYDS